MTAEETLIDYVDTYLLLVAKYGSDAECVQDNFLKLKDILIVEIYFLKNVRMIVSDDDMAGFVIFIDRQLKGIVEAYRPYHGTFPSYLSRIMELRSLSYIDTVIRRRHVSDYYTRNYMPYVECVAESGSDTGLYVKEDSNQEDIVKRRTMNRLRYFCARRPTRRRCLFVLLCTQMTSLSVATIDKFCEVLNCDKNQTFAIADYLYENERKNPKIKGRTFYEQKRDKHWSKLLECENRRRTSLHPERYEKSIEKHRSIFMAQLEELKSQRVHVPYTLVGEILNIDRVKVSSEVFRAKEILEMVSSDIINTWDGPIGILSSVSEETLRNSSISRFEPFKVFNIGLIRRSEACQNSVSKCLKEARSNMDC